jgi:hypothetical protein
MDCGEQSIDPSCDRVLCFPTEDGKMYSTVYGFGSCSATYACPRCLRRHDSKAFPAWVQDFSDLLDSDMIVEDFELRKGEKSIKKSHQLFERMVGKNRGLYISEKKVSKDVINRTHSVCSPPLRYDDPDNIPSDPMHTTQGLMSHLTQEVVVLLQRISGDGWAAATKADLLKKAEELSQIKKMTSYLNAKRIFLSYQTKIKKQREALDKELPQTFENKHRIERLTAAIESLESERDEYAIISKYTEMTFKIKGADEFLKLVKDSNKNENLEHAEFLFLNCIRQYGGYFNKEHGGMELTNGRGIQALENRKKIHAHVCEHAHATNPDLNDKVTEVMDWWLMMADILYPISLTLKSQQKVAGDRLYQLKLNTVKFGVEWRRKVTWKNSVFYKLHSLECMIIAFCEKHGFIGRGGAEGFENKHHEMFKLKDTLAPMANTGQRVTKLASRQQMHLLPGLESIFEKLRNAKKTYGKRGAYNKTSGRSRIEEDAPISHDQDQSDNVPADWFLRLRLVFFRLNLLNFITFTRGI